MAEDAKLDFASLLDDLIAASEAVEPQPREKIAAPSLRIDMLEQIERLQAENISLFPERAMQEYGSNAGKVREPLKEETPPHLQPALEDLFFLDPQSIARELGIASAKKPEDLDRARRMFAKRYHPDRVPEEFRERAALRMQIANMLIDDAKRARR
ncbi:MULTISPECIES: hypothetical protein [unclassified Aminobacter]|uniref:hypothetical protein n=1 Tax=unclassified Aminobacter TaxID=2644704 RepID=UPI000465CA38|nr:MULTISPECIES: hypothetical protein [unclassified Aminobacter]TWH33566.1 hypothetical protein L611_000200000860 [Aminobacter sp. J15]